ncbi:hypothetical protein JCM10914A_48290 [Paenibacillus sp. JCM 10914]|uniref:ABC-2 transporter permease n=1 Tax=Paenibacillus sp. JCM 10914 TaxID=1236974 RepID=UPI0003CC8F13|nr:ABC-2 transporter permease [Paenibacillus sp. JCM 10914]GAE06490.1 hypothetical protein JCM10914_2653 [Paenibacillus sp. JCM 10914]
MLNLFRKDFIAVKSSLWMILVYLVVFSIAFIPTTETSFYFVGIYTAFGAIIISTMIDIKSNHHHFLITLPISRKHIVKAKYLTVIAHTLFGVLASYGIHWIFRLAYPEFNKPDVPIAAILLSIGIVFVLISIYMPLFYALSKKGAGIINVVFMIALIVLAQPAAFLMNQVNVEGLTLLLIPAVLVVLLIGSYYLTVFLFNRKDI